MSETPRKLSDLQAADLPRCDWRDLMTITDGELTAEEQSALDAYFRQFVPYGPCPSCGAKRSDGLTSFLLGKPTFAWGIANGEMYCTAEGCGYPARAYHRNVGPLKFVEIILQYHPSELKSAEAQP